MSRMQLHFPARIIQKVRDKKITELFIDMTEDNKQILMGGNLLDSYGNVLNRKEPIKLISWEDKSNTAVFLISVKVKIGDTEHGTEPDTLYYALKIHEQV